jgi:hypothetical protein
MKALNDTAAASEWDRGYVVARETRLPAFAGNRRRPTVLTPFGWFFVLAMIVASAMGAALAFAT